MKIYLVITPFFPTEQSFRGPYVYDQVRAIERSGKYDKVIVMRSTSIWDKQTSYNYHGMRVYLFPMLQMPSYILNGLTNSINASLFLRRVRELGIDVGQVAVAHAHVSYFAACALALKKVNPNIITLVQHHDRDPFTIRNGKWATKAWNTRFRAKKNIELFNQVDCHVCISKVVEDNLLSFPAPGRYEDYPPYLRVLENVKNLPAIHPKNSYVLYNGVDTSQFHARGEAAKNTERFKIGCIANFIDLKDHMTLIKAVEIMIGQHQASDILVSFIGSGPLLEECRSYVAQNGLSAYFSFETEVDHSALPDYYRSLDLFVLPSCYEGFGCVFTEAYACGVPFMTCEHQGAAECIADDEADRWLIKPHDYRHLAELIVTYRENRYPQHLKVPYNIDVLIGDFLRKLDEL